MVKSTELLQCITALIEMSKEREALARRLIIHTADIQAFESDLFRICVLEFTDEVTFLKDRNTLLQKVTDESYCDGVRSVISSKRITFYDPNDNPILVLETDYFDSSESN